MKNNCFMCSGRGYYFTEMDTTKLVEEIKSGDNEGIHVEYDKLIYEIAKKYEPENVKELDKMVAGISFWYA